MHLRNLQNLVRLNLVTFTLTTRHFTPSASTSIGVSQADPVQVQIMNTTNTNENTQSSSNDLNSQSSPLPLPAPGDENTHQLDLSSGSGSVTLDHLGPMVVNVDGSLGRISNWAQMTEAEQRNTLRVLGKRNRARLEKLKETVPEVNGDEKNEEHGKKKEL